MAIPADSILNNMDEIVVACTNMIFMEESLKGKHTCDPITKFNISKEYVNQHLDKHLDKIQYRVGQYCYTATTLETSLNVLSCFFDIVCNADLEPFGMICYMGNISDVSKSMSARQKLEAQLTENNIVKEELDLLDSQNTVYKLIGPVLVKQDLDEAKATVGKRLEYINGEIQRYETLLKEMERKSEQHREVLASLQQEYQRAQGLAVGKA
ncbi:hypothetical protein NFI96_005728 [Prochilodus magdalenae]|nr:hypothetical protein NFI96_005728 [Prochilodus magdalenae]